MKNLYLSFFVAAFCLFACNDDDNDDATCVASLIENCGCTREYAPVCGCDNVTYSNACTAACNSITEFTAGECP